MHIRISATLTFCVLLSAFTQCTRDNGSSELLLPGAVLGAITKINSRSRTANTGVGGAITALSAAGSGLATGAGIALNIRDKHKQILIMALRHRSRPHIRGDLVQLARANAQARIIPVDFSCGGTCDTLYYSGPMTGNDVCDDGTGTVTIGSMNVYIDDGGSLFEYDMNGTLIYASCGTYGIDFNNFPEYELSTISGTMTVDGTMSSSLVEDVGSEAGFFFANTHLTTTSANNFRVNGGSALVLNLLVDEVESENILYDDTTDEIIAGVVSGTIAVSGTVNGERVDINATYVESF